MEEMQRLRVQSSMLIYALEQALGSFVLVNDHLHNELAEGAVLNIITREIQRGNTITKEQTNLIIEASYLDEIFNFALNVAKDTHVNEYLLSLKALCHYLKIFDIRNAVSHPNRNFPECYWFRTATIASDPLIEKLGLHSVTETLHSAISGNLNEPPEHWLNDVQWAISNNLPRNFDHEITGLLGRDKEFKELKDLISIPRENLIAIVAPGGIGKTALILQYLKDLSLTPESNKYVDSIVFCSLKNEELTADGVKTLNAIGGVEAVKINILDALRDIYDDLDFESFNDACKQLSSKKVLLCVDNLETLLINSQDEFALLNRSLPLHWRMIVTSRISVGSATTITLDPLGEKHSVNLARNYLKKRGIFNIDTKDLIKIAKSANHNPLAIRLTVDLYLKGKDIPESIAQSQKDIASFSYKNLIDSLSDNSVSILEAIFAQQKSNRTDLAELLDLSFENVTESINELSKTSLIHRGSEDESDCYRLSDSIRELLLLNPRNAVVRLKVTEEIRKRKTIILEHRNRQSQLGVTVFSEEFIEPETPDLIKILTLDTNKALSKSPMIQRKLRALQVKYNELINQWSSSSYLFNYSFSRLLCSIGDTQGAMVYISKAEALNPQSARVKANKAWLHFKNCDYPQSAKLYRELVKLGYAQVDKSDKTFSFRLLKGYLQSLLFQIESDEIFEFTADWETNPEYRVLCASYRAAAYKRTIEHLVNTDIKSTEAGLIKAMDVLNRLFELEGYTYTSSQEALKIIKELHYVSNRRVKPRNQFIFKCLEFIANHLFDVVSNLRNESIQSKEVKNIIDSFVLLSPENNPIHKANWYKSLDLQFNYDPKQLEKLKASGYTIVEVHNIPHTREGGSPYIFAQDNSSRTYYLHVSTLSKGGWMEWANIDVGRKLAIKYGKSTNGEKTFPATEVKEISIIGG